MNQSAPWKRLSLSAALLLGATGSLFAQDAAPAAPDSGDTAWMLMATVLVLLMTLPGLALFYGGLVRAKNVLSVLVQCFVIAALMSVIWVVYGYSVATTGEGAYFGNFSKAFLAGVEHDTQTAVAAGRLDVGVQRDTAG